MQYLPSITQFLVDFDSELNGSYRFNFDFEDKNIEAALVEAEEFLCAGKWFEGQLLLLKVFNEYVRSGKSQEIIDFHCLKLEMCRATLLLGEFDYVETGIVELIEALEAENGGNVKGLLGRAFETVAVLRATQGRIQDALDYQDLAVRNYVESYGRVPFETRAVLAAIHICSGQFNKGLEIIEELSIVYDTSKDNNFNRMLYLAALKSNVIYNLGDTNGAAEIILNSISEYSTKGNANQVSLGLAYIAATDMVRLTRFESHRFELMEYVDKVLFKLGSKTSEVVQLVWIKKMNQYSELGDSNSLNYIVDMLSQGLIDGVEVADPQYFWQASFYEVYAVFLCHGNLTITQSPAMAVKILQRVVEFFESREGPSGINTLVAMSHLASTEYSSGLKEGAFSLAQETLNAAMDTYGIGNLATRQILLYWANIAIGLEKQVLVRQKFFELMENKLSDSWLEQNTPLSPTDVMLESLWIVVQYSLADKLKVLERIDQLTSRVDQFWGNGHLLTSVTTVLNELLENE